MYGLSQSRPLLKIERMLHKAQNQKLYNYIIIHVKNPEKAAQWSKMFVWEFV